MWGDLTYFLISEHAPFAVREVSHAMQQPGGTFRHGNIAYEAIAARTKQKIVGKGAVERRMVEVEQRAIGALVRKSGHGVASLLGGRRLHRDGWRRNE